MRRESIVAALKLIIYVIGAIYLILHYWAVDWACVILGLFIAYNMINSFIEAKEQMSDDTIIGEYILDEEQLDILNKWIEEDGGQLSPEHMVELEKMSNKTKESMKEDEK